MQVEHASRMDRRGQAGVGASIAIVLALAGAVGVAIVLKGQRASTTGEASADAAGNATLGAPSGATSSADVAAASPGAASPAAPSEASPAVSPPAIPAATPSSAPPAVGLPKLIDLGAGKCIPCKMMAPILEALKKDFAGKFEVTFIDVWENPDEAKKYGIKLIPTQIFFDASGKERFRHEGFYSREDILAKWKELGVDLAGGPPAIVREEPLVKDARAAEARCSLCDGDRVGKTRVTVTVPESQIALCSPHCFFIYKTSHRDPASLAGKVSVTDWASGEPVPAENAWYLCGSDEKGRATVRAFRDKEAAIAERQKDGGDVLAWGGLVSREETVRCAFCDRATYPVDSPRVQVEGARMYACCTLCGLGVAARFKKDIEMEAWDGLTGASIRVKTLDGRVASLEPSTAVAWFGQKRGPEGKMVSAGCFKQRFFANADNLAAWIEKNPAATGRLITIQQGLDDKLKMSPEQIKNACKLGECAPVPSAKP